MLENKTMITYAYDYETYWDTEKEDPCTVVELGAWLYTQHPRFDAYLLSVVGTDGFEWVGNPRDFEWSRFEGARLVAHNAGFELAVTEYLIGLGAIPRVNPAEVCDTADMAAYLKVPRSLEQATRALLGFEMDKGMRAASKGKTWASMSPEFQQQMRDYCLDDSRLELRLWLECNDQWPQDERTISASTREMCWAGLPTDIPGAKADIELLKAEWKKARALIPWPDPALSPKSVKKACEKAAIPPPRSMAKDSPEFEAWLFRYGDKHPWAAAMGKLRSVNMLLKKYETMVQRTDANGIHRYGLKYFGGHLGRDSGDSGFNPQNCARKPMHGVYLRNRMIKAPDGYVLGITDESSIEPKVLACISGDEEKVGLMREGMDVYEIQARIDKEYDDPRPLKEINSDIRQYNKVKVLACGYGAGPPKVQFIAKKEVGLILDDEQAAALVYKFRSRRFIPDLWAQLELHMRSSKRDGNYTMELPSGRTLLYRNIKDFGGLSAEVIKYGKFTRLPWWGGSLTENAVQAIARDIFFYHVLRIREAGYQILLRAHDEVVTLHKIENAEAELAEIVQIMRTPPIWMPEFPAGAEGHLSPVYKKF
jgi:hypothetical protein